MAEFLHILAEQYDYPQLADEILRELSNKEFNSNDTRGPKSVSSFIAKLSELAPRLVIKQMTMLAKQLDSEASDMLHLDHWITMNELTSLSVIYVEMLSYRSLREHDRPSEQPRRTW